MDLIPSRYHIYVCDVSVLDHVTSLSVWHPFRVAGIWLAWYSTLAFAVEDRVLYVWPVKDGTRVVLISSVLEYQLGQGAKGSVVISCKL